MLRDEQLSEQGSKFVGQSEFGTLEGMFDLTVVLMIRQAYSYCSTLANKVGASIVVLSSRLTQEAAACKARCTRMQCQQLESAAGSNVHDEIGHSSTSASAQHDHTLLQRFLYTRNLHQG